MIGDILQPTHLLLILVVALIVLGPKRLPEVGKSLGRGLRDFRHALSAEDHEPQRESLQHAAVATPQPTASAQPAPEPQTQAPTQPQTQAPAQPQPGTPAQAAPAEPVEQPQPVSTGAPSEPGERPE